MPMRRRIRDRKANLSTKALGTFKYMRKLAVGRTWRSNAYFRSVAQPGPSDADAVTGAIFAFGRPRPHRSITMQNTLQSIANSSSFAPQCVASVDNVKMVETTLDAAGRLCGQGASPAIIPLLDPYMRGVWTLESSTSIAALKR